MQGGHDWGERWTSRTVWGVDAGDAKRRDVLAVAVLVVKEKLHTGGLDVPDIDHGV
jgi:hypothetical protein